MKPDWLEKRLRDVSVEVSTGPFGSVLHKSDYVEDGVPLVNPINIVGEEIVPDPSKLISDATKQRLASYILRKGDIVVARRGEIGRCAVVGPSQDGWVCGTGSFFIRPQPSVDSRFIASLIRSPLYKQRLEQSSTGTTMKNLSNTSLGELVISVPELPEQRRIVAILDKAFASITIARANAERNLQNARELFESERDEVFERRGSGYARKSLSEICAINSRLVDPRKKAFLNLIHVGAGNMESETGVLADLQTAREENLISGKFLFEKSAVLYSKIRPYLRKAARPDFAGLCSADVYPLDPIEGYVTRDYLYHLLLSKFFTKYAIEGSARAGMPKVNRDHLFEFKCWLPNIEEQVALTSMLDRLQQETQRLESIYQRKLAALDELKHSLLHEAFSGKL